MLFSLNDLKEQAHSSECYEKSLLVSLLELLYLRCMFSKLCWISGYCVVFLVAVASILWMSDCSAENVLYISFHAVYRIYTAILFHGSLLHVLFNMMALVPLGSELERIMGSVRLLYVTILLATSNAIFHVLIALLVTYNPFVKFDYLMNECVIGFSGVFSMIVIETSLSGVQSRRLGIHHFWKMQFNLFILITFFPLR